MTSDRLSLDPPDWTSELVASISRFGWIAKGVVFLVIGVLGLELARKDYTSEDADQGGALALIADAPAGRVLVLAVGVGLLAFAAWQVWAAAVGDGGSIVAVIRRIGGFGLGVAYALVGVTGIEVALTGQEQAATREGATSPDSLTARVLDLPGGRLVVVLVGLGTIVAAGYHVWRAWTRNFLDDVDRSELTGASGRATEWLGVAGMIARALTLAVAGVMLIVAAWRYDPDEAAGIDQTLRTLAELPGGQIVLAVAALGLVAAGLYDIVTFRIQEID